MVQLTLLRAALAASAGSMAVFFTGCKGEDKKKTPAAKTDPIWTMLNAPKATKDDKEKTELKVNGKGFTYTDNSVTPAFTATLAQEKFDVMVDKKDKKGQVVKKKDGSVEKTPKQYKDQKTGKWVNVKELKWVFTGKVEGGKLRIKQCCAKMVHVDESKNNPKNKDYIKNVMAKLAPGVTTVDWTKDLTDKGVTVKKVECKDKDCKGKNCDVEKDMAQPSNKNNKK